MVPAPSELIDDDLNNNNNNAVNITHFYFVLKAKPINICRSWLAVGSRGLGLGEDSVLEISPAAVGESFDSAGRWPST